MAVIFDGIKNLAGNVLPNVKIENVMLSVGTDPEPESNPHINSSREYTTSGISGQKLIQNTNNTLNEKQIQNKNLFIDVTLSILNVENSNSSLILNQINYLDFVYVKVIQSFSQALTNELIQTKFPVNYKNLKNIVDYTEEIFSLSDFYQNKTLSLQIVNSDKKVFKHIKNTRFTSKNPQKQHLDIFAFAYIDVDQLINKFELNIKSDYEIKGNISKESIISNDKVTNQSYVLTDQNNNLFIGTLIKGVNGKFYSKKPTSIEQESILQPLNVVSVSNKKIIDSRNLDSLSIENTINVQPTIINSINSSLSLNFLVQEKSYVSELYLSRQKDNTYSGFFVFDIISYLKQNSKTPEIYDNPKCLDYLRIKKLNLIRKRVKTIDSIVYPFNEYTPDKTIISTSEQVFGNLSNKISFYDFYNNLYTTSFEDLNNNKFGSTLPSFATIDTLRKVASISEIIVPSAANFRVLTFTDYEISKLTTGEYVYEINIDIEDSTKELIKTNLQLLNNSKLKLLSYLSEAQRNDMFSVSENKQTKKFISTQKNKYNSLNLNSAINLGTINQNVTIQNSPWVFVPSSIVAIEKEIFFNNITNKINEFYNMLNPTTTNPTRINNVVDYLDLLETKIKQKYSIEDEENKNINSYKSNTIKVLNFIKTFKNVIDSEIKKIGIDFIDTPELNLNNLVGGLPRIGKDNFELRINNEIQKYFPSTSNLSLNTLNSSFSSEDVESISNITDYSTCFLSPSSARINNQKQISFSNTDNSNLELSKYDDIINSAITTTTTTKNNDVSNQLLGITNFSITTINNFSSNLTTDVQLSFINKTSLLVNSQDIFDNSAFYNADRSFNIQDSCDQSNIEIKNEENLLNLTPLVNSIFDSVVRPDSIDDTINNTESINTIDKFDVLSSTSIIGQIKQKNTILPQNLNTSLTNTTPTNAISNKSGILQTTILSNEKQNSLLSVPLQIKSLMVSSLVDTKFKLNQFNFDPFLHPSTKNFMRLNFQTICQTEYLAGFENSDISKPIWKLLTKQDYDKLKGLVIIRTKKYDNILLNIGTEKGFDYDIYNEFCIIEKEQISSNKISSTNTNIIPNINLVVGNRNLNTNNILSNLNINLNNDEQTQIAKQLIVINTIDSDVKSEYTFSKIELDNAN